MIGHFPEINMSKTVCSAITWQHSYVITSCSSCHSRWSLKYNPDSKLWNVSDKTKHFTFRKNAIKSCSLTDCLYELLFGEVPGQHNAQWTVISWAHSIKHGSWNQFAVCIFFWQFVMFMLSKRDLLWKLTHKSVVGWRPRDSHCCSLSISYNRHPIRASFCCGEINIRCTFTKQSSFTSFSTCQVIPVHTRMSFK